MKVKIKTGPKNNQFGDLKTWGWVGANPSPPLDLHLGDHYWPVHTCSFGDLPPPLEQHLVVATETEARTDMHQRHLFLHFCCVYRGDISRSRTSPPFADKSWHLAIDNYVLCVALSWETLINRNQTATWCITVAVLFAVLWNSLTSSTRKTRIKWLKQSLFWK